jgi:hypothetical protein
MNHLAMQSIVGAVLIIFAIPGRPGMTGAQEQTNSSQKTQQDQDKQKKDKAGSSDNSTSKNAKSDDAAKNGDKPAPLFGSLNVKSSRQTKDSATLGFNGVDDNGQVQKSFLSAAATGSDTSAVQKLASESVNNTELDQFIQQGDLNTNSPAKKSSNSGAKP